MHLETQQNPPLRRHNMALQEWSYQRGAQEDSLASQDKNDGAVDDAGKGRGW